MCGVCVFVLCVCVCVVYVCVCVWQVCVCCVLHVCECVCVEGRELQKEKAILTMKLAKINSDRWWLDYNTAGSYNLIPRMVHVVPWPSHNLEIIALEISYLHWLRDYTGREVRV